MRQEQWDSRFHGNDGNDERNAPAWVPAFLAELMITGSLRAAVAHAGIAFETVSALRRAEPEFAKYWDRALLVHRTWELEALATGDYWGGMQ